MNNLRHLHVNSWLHCDTYVDISSMRMLAFCIDIDTLDIWWIANLFDANFFAVPVRIMMRIGILYIYIFKFWWSNRSANRFIKLEVHVSNEISHYLHFALKK